MEKTQDTSSQCSSSSQDNLATPRGQNPPMVEPAEVVTREEPNSRESRNHMNESAPANKSNTLMPVTVKMLNEAIANSVNGEVIINNTVATTLRLVGRILDIQLKETRATFKFDDGTGHIKCGLWLFTSLDNMEPKGLEDISNGNYIIINGKLDKKQGENSIECYACRKVTDFNDVTHHFLHCIHTHLLLTKPKPHPVPKPQGSVIKSFHGQASQLKVYKPGKEEAAVYQTLSNVPQAEQEIPLTGSQFTNKYNTLGTPLSEAVLGIVRDMTKGQGSADGIHIEVLREKIAVTTTDLRSILHDLASVGELYTTVDNDHFKAT